MDTLKLIKAQSTGLDILRHTDRLDATVRDEVQAHIVRLLIALTDAIETASGNPILPLFEDDISEDTDSLIRLINMSKNDLIMYDTDKTSEFVYGKLIEAIDEGNKAMTVLQTNEEC